MGSRCGIRTSKPARVNSDPDLLGQDAILEHPAAQADAHHTGVLAYRERLLAQSLRETGVKHCGSGDSVVPPIKQRRHEWRPIAAPYAALIARERQRNRRRCAAAVRLRFQLHGRLAFVARAHADAQQCGGGIE